MKKKILIFVIALNLLIVGGEIAFGVIGHSLSLITDALHNFSDVLALFVGFLALLFAEKKANEKMTFGYIRSEMMASFVNALFLTSVMVYVIVESIRNIISPPEAMGLYMILAAGVAVIANGLSVFLLKGQQLHHQHGHSHADQHEHSEDLNIRAMTLHLISDVGISLAVVIGGIVIHFTGFHLIDPILSILFALYIIAESVKIGIKAFHHLIDRQENDLRKYVDKLTQIDGIRSVHGVHLTQPSSRDRLFSAHLVLDGNPSLDKIEKTLEKARDALADMQVTHTVLQPESTRYEQEDILCSRH